MAPPPTSWHAVLDAPDEAHAAFADALRCYRHDGDAPPFGADIHEHGRKFGVVAVTGAGRALAVARTGASPVTAAGRSIALAEG